MWVKLATVTEGDPKTPFLSTINQAIGLMSRVFANGPGDRGSIQVESY